MNKLLTFWCLVGTPKWTVRVVSVVPSLDIEPRQNKIIAMSTEAHLHQKHRLNLPVMLGLRAAVIQI